MMMPRDLSDVPTLACLNKSQKRALILRDQLRYLEPAHLDAFLDGVTTDEPPTYKNINGTVYPPLAQVTIKEEATRFDFGNVQFPEEGGATYRAYLTVEDDRFEMRTTDPLPQDDAELGSLAIHRFVAENMFPLFRTKYKAIHARMEKINEARRVAYNMLDYPPAKFEIGETLARLTVKSKSMDDSSRGKYGGSRKRKEITKHVSNKRQRVGLETIPDKVKSETFNTIPAQIKVDFFNTIIKTAFPNFDNLIMASWNVVSVYSNVGSDFPELHKAIAELKGALEEFESAYAPPRTKGGKNQKEATVNQQNTGRGSRTATPSDEVRDTSTPVARSDVAAVNQTQQDSSSTDQDYQEDKDDSQHQMPPPRLLQASQQYHKQDERHPAPPAAPTPLDTRAHSVPRRAAKGSPPTPNPNPTPSPSSSCLDSQHLLPRMRTTRDRSADSRSHPSPSRYEHLLAPSSELMRKRQEYTASLAKVSRSSAGARRGQHTQEDDDEDERENSHAGMCEQRRSGSGGPLGASMGGSVLGAEKVTRSAPVAPMLHVRRKRGG